MEINCIDKRGSTPLHWACYSKSEYALSFIIALNPKLDAQDNLGFTPLHLAIRSVGVDDSTRSVRSLLLKGAKRSIRNYEGQKCEEMIKENID
jgi:ankyrin repeat protein